MNQQVPTSSSKSSGVVYSPYYPLSSNDTSSSNSKSTFYPSVYSNSEFVNSNMSTSATEYQGLRAAPLPPPYPNSATNNSSYLNSLYTTPHNLHSESPNTGYILSNPQLQQSHTQQHHDLSGNDATQSSYNHANFLGYQFSTNAYNHNSNYSNPQALDLVGQANYATSSYMSNLSVTLSSAENSNSLIN